MHSMAHDKAERWSPATGTALTLRAGLLAGLVGGTAEILWIWAYGGPDSLAVARGIAAAVGVSSACGGIVLGALAIAGFFL